MGLRDSAIHNPSVSTSSEMVAQGNNTTLATSLVSRLGLPFSDPVGFRPAARLSAMVGVSFLSDSDGWLW